MGNLIGFDLDDTLIPTVVHYIDAQEKLNDFVLDSFKGLKFNRDEIDDMREGIQMDLVSKMGFSSEVFPGSFEHTYVKLSEVYGARATRGGRSCAYELGRRVFNEKAWGSAGLLPGSEDVLDFFKDRGDRLVMITLGDDEIQRRKIEVVGLDKWFSGDDVYVDLRSKGDIMKRLFTKEERADGLFVGDSYRHDVRPALGAGVRVAYIPQGSWHGDGIFNGSDPSVIKLRDISKVKDIYESSVLK